MTDMRIVFCTCASEEESSRIARGLVENRLAACAQVSSPMRSYYRWEGELHADTEWLITIKTTRERFEDVSAYIQSVHSYSVPEITSIPVTETSSSYLAWLRGELSTELPRETRDA